MNDTTLGHLRSQVDLRKPNLFKIANMWIRLHYANWKNSGFMLFIPITAILTTRYLRRS